MSIRFQAFASFCAIALPAGLLHAQAAPTATRAGDLQVGAGFTIANSDYIEANRGSNPQLRGGAIYVDFDPRPHLGAEFEIHQANSTGSDHTYERTYEIGLRYFRTYGPAVPYAKAMVGRGVLNFPGQYNALNNTYGSSPANLAYNLYALGAGTDLKVLPWLHLRAEYEYQSWFGIQGGLHPQMVTLGAAYHFNGDLRGGR